MASPDAPSFDPGRTPDGELPPWEVAKAYAFHVVIEKMKEVTGMSAKELLGVMRSMGQNPTEVRHNFYII